MDQPRAIVDFEGFEAGRRLAFGEPVAEFSAREASGVEAAVRAAEAAALAGAWVVGFLAYEAAPALDPSFAVRDGCRLPLAWFGAFESPRRVHRPRRRASFPPRSCASIPDGWSGSEGRRAHAAAVARIREAIGRGDVYQVNHTFRLRRILTEDPAELYELLVRTVPAPYAAYVRVPPHHVVSISPELFFRRDGRRLTTRPMKGTAPRGRWPEEDDRNAAALAASEKDRAENLMIVDLLRNDLGRVASFGTVRAQDLFRVERHATVHQMTSTVVAEARPDASLLEVMRALFPCGSVTGAPKIAATQAIARLESAPREVYCGAIGVIRPGGDCTFNVAIRTALVDDSDSSVTYGVGGGITWASTAAGEWEEALGKAAILRPARAAAGLIETFRAEGGTPVRWPDHRRRLLSSAEALGHPADEARIDAAVARACHETARARVILRLELSVGGAVSVSVRPLPHTDRMRARRAWGPVDSGDPRLFHKTADRSVYDAFRTGLPDEEEALLWNERGEATEFTRGNLVAELHGRLVTPPVRAGLLPGVFRDELVRSATAVEGDIPIADLETASAVWFVSSAREWVPVLWNPVGEPGVAR